MACLYAGGPAGGESSNCSVWTATIPSRSTTMHGRGSVRMWECRAYREILTGTDVRLTLANRHGHVAVLIQAKRQGTVTWQGLLAEIACLGLCCPQAALSCKVQLGLHSICRDYLTLSSFTMLLGQDAHMVGHAVHSGLQPGHGQHLCLANPAALVCKAGASLAEPPGQTASCRCCDTHFGDRKVGQRRPAALQRSADPSQSKPADKCPGLAVHVQHSCSLAGHTPMLQVQGSHWLL